MHAYSIDRDLRAKVTIGIFVLSMVTSLLLESTFSDILQQLSHFFEESKIQPAAELIKWLGFMPDIVGVSFWYIILSVTYDRRIWKCKLAKKFHKIPDLNGSWSGELISSYPVDPMPITMEIEQTWSKISFKSTFPKANSESYSNVAAIYVDGNQGTVISFAFINNGYNVKDGLPFYDGYNILTLKDPDKIKARYFNNRPNPDPNIKGGNKGTFEIERIKDGDNLTTVNLQQK